MPWAGALRREISARNQQIARATGSLHELTGGEIPSVIFGRKANGVHANFHPVSYRNICANPQWRGRLAKVHTSSRNAARSGWRWMELDCANSSDALLMNIFCYRRVLRDVRMCSMLGITPGLVPQFGFKPRIPFTGGKTDRTEMDMKLGSLLIEAKLTESDFQTAPARLVERYRDLHEAFDVRALPAPGAIVLHYQLIRGVLAAHFTGGSFCVLCDARRPDLVEKWYGVLRSVRLCDLRCRLQLLAWQELAAALPEPLRRFLAGKYGIMAS